MANIALQLYTVRDDLQKDFVGTLKAVAKMGYAGIEGGGTGPLTVSDFKKLMQDLKLNPIGAHAGLNGLEGPRGELTLAMYAEIGTKFIAISEHKEDADGWRKLGKKMDEVGKAAKSKGITFQYHNHAHEFEKLGGEFALDILLGSAGRAYVGSQLDVGWVQRAGENPVAWLEKLGDRVKTVHIKDTTAGPKPEWTEVGNGIVDFKAVHSASQELGIDWYIVEQDTCARPPLESAAISLQNILKISTSS